MKRKLSLFLVIIMLLTFCPPTIYAGGQSIKDKIDYDIKISREISTNKYQDIAEGEIFDFKGHYRINIDWSAKVELASISVGDYFDIPVEFSVPSLLYQEVDEYDVIDSGGDVVGKLTFKYDPSTGNSTTGYTDYKIHLEFTKEISGQNNIKGNLFLSFYYLFDEENENKDISISIDSSVFLSGKTGDYTGDDIVSDETLVNKFGALYSDKDLIAWAVVFNPYRYDVGYIRDYYSQNTPPGSDLYNAIQKLSDDSILEFTDTMANTMCLTQMKQYKNGEFNNEVVPIDKEKGIYGQKETQTIGDGYFKIYEIDYNVLYEKLNGTNLTDKYWHPNEQAYAAIISAVADTPSTMSDFLKESNIGVNVDDTSPNNKFNLETTMGDISNKAYIIVYLCDVVEKIAGTEYENSFSGHLKITPELPLPLEFKGEVSGITGGGTVSGNENKIFINKVDSDGNPMTGISFKVTSERNGSFTSFEETITTNSSGCANTGSLGSYTKEHVIAISEVSTPNGYIPLPFDIKFTIDPTNGYAIDKILSESAPWYKITRESTGAVTVTIINNKLPVLTIKKSVIGTTTETNGFLFKVTDSQDNPIDLTGKTSGTLTANTGEFKLKKDEIITISGLDVGTYYVEELTTGYKAKYEVDSEGEKTGNKAEIVLSANKTTNISFVNEHIEETGMLTVEKVILGDASKTSDEFVFILKKGGNPVNLSDTKFSFEGNKTFKTNGKDGKFVLKGGENITIKGLLAGNDYTIEEESSGYTTHYVVGSNNEVTGTITSNFDISSTNSQKVTFTNEKNYARGDIIISKTVTGTTTETNGFLFKVTDSQDNPIDLTGKTSGTLTANTGEFKLKKDETITISGLDVGTYYVEELTTGYKAKYEVDSEGEKTGNKAEIVVSTNKTTNISFINEYIEETGMLTVEKVISGDASKTSDEFVFILKKGGLPVNLSNTKFSFGGNKTFKTNGQDGKFVLKGGENITIKGLLAGNDYTIEEESSGYTTHYVVGSNNEVPGTTTGDFVISSTNPQKIVFTNEKNHTSGDIIISKTVKGTTTETNGFLFKVTDSQYNPIDLTGKTSGELTANTGEFKLKKDEIITISGLDVGTYYVEELTTGYKAKYEVDSEGEKSGNKAEVVVSANKTTNISFINEYIEETGMLTVEKVISGDASKTSDEFVFVLKKGGLPVNLSNTKFSFGGNKTFKTNGQDGKFVLKGGENITIKGLLAGNDYTIEEESSGYTTHYVVGSNNEVPGTTTGDFVISSTNPQKIVFTNEKNHTSGDIIISKTVTGTITDKKFEFTIDFGGVSAEETYSYSIGSHTGTIQSGDTILLGHGETALIKNIPNDTTYIITEKKVVDFTSSAENYIISGMVSSNVSRAEFINMYTPQKTTIKITKVWNDEDNRYNGRPENLKMRLYSQTKLEQNRKFEKTIVPEWKKVGNTWTASITDLNKYRDGEEIVYTMEEIVPEGYFVEYSKDTLSITNTWIEEPEEPQIILYVNKILTDKDGNKIGNETMFTVQLLDDKGEVIATVRVPANGGKVAIPGLESGKIYMIRELVGDNFDFIGFNIGDGELISKDYLVFRSVLPENAKSGKIYVTLNNMGSVDDLEEKEPKDPPEIPDDPEIIEIPPEIVPLGPPEILIPPTTGEQGIMVYLIIGSLSIGVLIVTQSKGKRKKIINNLKS